MNIRDYIILLVLTVSLASCKDEKTEKRTNEIPESISTDLLVDHLNIWVKNPKKAKERLISIGFNAIPDSLSQVHTGQGTSGRYFNFLNGYLELIFVNDQEELERNNRKNKELDFIERANFEKNGASPFSISLKIKEYAVEKIPFEKVSYHQAWMEENVHIYAAKNSKKYLKEPSIFVIYPEIESQRFETLAEVQDIPDEYAFWRESYMHPNGAKKLTKIVITSNDLNANTETVKAVNRIENLTVKNGKEHLMELFFDNNSQGKSFDLRPELQLIINL